MDSTIVTTETLDELAAHAGVGEQRRRHHPPQHERRDRLRRRAARAGRAAARPRPRRARADLGATPRSSPGARELVATMRAHGAITALVSGGFTFFTGRVAAQARLRHAPRQRRCSMTAPRCSARCRSRSSTATPSSPPCSELAAARGLALDDCLAVGDGANDLDMIRAAGLGVAFHAKPIVAEAADARIDHCGLRALLFMQGYRADEFVQVIRDAAGLVAAGLRRTQQAGRGRPALRRRHHARDAGADRARPTTRSAANSSPTRPS